jgi:hypothetical protein
VISAGLRPTIESFRERSSPRGGGRHWKSCATGSVSLEWGNHPMDLFSGGRRTWHMDLGLALMRWRTGVYPGPRSRFPTVPISFTENSSSTSCVPCTGQVAGKGAMRKSSVPSSPTRTAPRELVQSVGHSRAGPSLMDIGRQDNMPRPPYTTEQIIGKLREAEVLLSHPTWNVGQVGRRLARSAGAWGLATTPTTGGEKSMAAFGQTRRNA